MPWSGPSEGLAGAVSVNFGCYMNNGLPSPAQGPEERLGTLVHPVRDPWNTPRMLAYRAETALLPPVQAARGEERTAARAAPQDLFRCDAGLQPDPARRTLTLHLLHLGDSASTRPARSSPAPPCPSSTNGSRNPAASPRNPISATC